MSHPCKPLFGINLLISKVTTILLTFVQGKHNLGGLARICCHWSSPQSVCGFASMEMDPCKIWAMGLLVLYRVTFQLSHSSVCGFSKVRGVNLGGWLVVKGWIKPSLFDEIPNKDMLDGAQVQLRPVILQKYVSVDNGGGMRVTVDRPGYAFYMENLPGSSSNIAPNKFYLLASTRGLFLLRYSVGARQSQIDNWKTDDISSQDENGEDSSFDFW